MKGEKVWTTIRASSRQEARELAKQRYLHTAVGVLYPSEYKYWKPRARIVRWLRKRRQA